MSKTLSIPPLPQGWHNLALIAGVTYVIYQLSKGFNRLDNAADIATKPIGQAWSDISAWAGGYRAVEHTPLIIRDFYLDSHYQITDEAWRVLVNVESYRPLMTELFNGRVLKSQYRHLINKQITEL
ncbi:hypothetical protein [Shewanella marina]|uniref:hypothetical protein n=1 Tax=Shewanella marina TaxID=487319 RepID=UPI00046FEBDC|nr:hypothetical protein [Shewanella marina]